MKFSSEQAPRDKPWSKRLDVWIVGAKQVPGQLIPRDCLNVIRAREMPLSPDSGSGNLALANRVRERERAREKGLRGRMAVDADSGWSRSVCGLVSGESRGMCPCGRSARSAGTL